MSLCRSDDLIIFRMTRDESPFVVLFLSFSLGYHHQLRDILCATEGQNWLRDKGK